MSQLWYGDSGIKSRALAKFLIKKSFTPRDFAYVVHSDCSVDDLVIAELMQRAAGSKGKAWQNLKVNSTKALEEMDEEGIAMSQYDRMAAPSWYRDLDYDLKAYVITRMSFLWFKKIDDYALRKKAQGKIVRKFTEEDFNAAANPGTPYEVMAEIAERTRGREITQRDLEIRAMKKKLCESGLIKNKTADRYVRDIVGIFGNEAMPVDELENRVVERWTGFPTFQAWLNNHLSHPQ